MEEALNKRIDAWASLTEDLVFEIIRCLPSRSLIRCKLVCKTWYPLISDANNQDTLPQTVAGLFYDGAWCNRYFASVTGVSRPSLNFLPFMEEYVAVSDCCNSLILCWCLGPDGYRYVVCNPVMKKYKIPPPKKYKILPPITYAVGEARLGFDPTASSHFHVIDYVERPNSSCAGVEIYSFETTAWINLDSEWGEGTIVPYFRTPSVFLNGCLHILGDHVEGTKILVVDTLGNTWRKIDGPSGENTPCINLRIALCVCTVGDPNDSRLSIWILQDYGTNNWALKHTVTMQELFGSINISFGFDDCIDDYTVIIVHLEWNFILVAGEDRTIIASDTNRGKVHLIPAHIVEYSKRSVKQVFVFRPVYLPYVPLFLDSLSDL